MMSAVQVHNNPQIQFKAEIFIVNAVIAWTYLLHAYFRKEKVDYRYHKVLPSGRKKFQKTKYGANKNWALAECLNHPSCPVSGGIKNNLLYLLAIRHEIEHQMTLRIDATLTARFQACCLNFNAEICKHFGDVFDLSKELSLSLQFSRILKEQDEVLTQFRDLPANIRALNRTFEDTLSTEEYNDPAFSYRVAFVELNANRKGHADYFVEFIKPGSEEAAKVNRVLLKQSKQAKVGAKEIVRLVKEKGYKQFSLSAHTAFWQSIDGQNEEFGFGELIGQWWWYKDVWLRKVLSHCKENKERYQ